FPEAEGALRAMRSCGLKRGLLTNSDGQPGLKRRRLESGPLPLDLFQGVLVAGDEVPQLKPDPEPFRVLLKELGLEPQDAAYVGDNPRVDVPGAKEAGMYVFLARSEGPGPPFPDARFGNLMEVARALSCFSRSSQ
ncbi:MAG: HAD family hydrolase, partial [Conexivisphaerales archaeon]|nr:HAD family hydrolase [Conexivisphaerales archaeon]